MANLDSEASGQAARVVDRRRHDVYPFIDPTGNLKNSMKGKVVLVTGAGGGVGRKVALYFAIAGASKVYVTGRSQERLDETAALIAEQVASCETKAVTADIRSAASVQALFAAFEVKPSVLVNNVGAVTSQGPIVDSNPESWWDIVEINLKSVYLCSAELLKALNAGSGTIVNVSTSVSIGPAAGGISSYSCAKAAVNRFTQWLHAEYSEQGVQAIAVHPGGIAETGMGQMAPSAYRSRLWDTVGLASGTILYLATPRAKFLSGRFVYSNWDMELVEGRAKDIVEQNLLVQNLILGDAFKNDIIPPEQS